MHDLRTMTRLNEEAAERDLCKQVKQRKYAHGARSLSWFERNKPRTSVRVKPGKEAFLA